MGYLPHGNNDFHLRQLNSSIFLKPKGRCSRDATKSRNLLYAARADRHRRRLRPCRPECDNGRDSRERHRIRSLCHRGMGNQRGRHGERYHHRQHDEIPEDRRLPSIWCIECRGSAMECEKRDFGRQQLLEQCGNRHITRSFKRQQYSIEQYLFGNECRHLLGPFWQQYLVEQQLLLHRSNGRYRLTLLRKQYSVQQ